MAEYSHSWENMAKVIACTAQEEECVLFTGNTLGDGIKKLCSHRQCQQQYGVWHFSKWINTSIYFMIWTAIFKFGGELKSEGEFAIPARIAGKM